MAKTLSFYFTFVIIFISTVLSAQNVGINTGGAPDNSAGLEIDFNDRGFLLPRMTTAERDAIASPALSLQIFNTTVNCLQIYMGSRWANIVCDCMLSEAFNATAGSNATQTTIDANWDASSGATSYRLDVDDNADFSSPVTGFDDLNVGNVVTYTVTGLTCGTTYYYRVRAVNDCGTGANTNTISYATPTCCNNGTLDWGVSDDQTASADNLYHVAVDATGVYIAGAINGSTLQLIEKRNLTTGAVIWTQTADRGSGGPYEWVEGVSVDGTGVYLSGHERTPTGYRWRIEKRDLNDGTILWTQTVLDGSTNLANANALDATGLYTAGQDYVGGSNDFQWRVEKRDLSTGNVTWATTTNVSGNQDIPHGIAVDATGAYTVGYDNGAGNFGWRIDKRNLSTGAVIWTQTNNPSSGGDFAYAVAIDATGIYVAGTDQTAGNDQWRIEKRDLSSGAVIWTQTNNPSAGSDIPRSVTVDGTGVYITGKDNSPGNDQWRLEKRDLSTGAIIWTQTSNLSTGVDYPWGITNDNDYLYIVGEDFSSGNAELRIERRCK